MPLTALEFYSGIGGLHYALREVCPDARVLAAFDINEVANRTYEHNFGLRPTLVRLSATTALRRRRRCVCGGQVQAARGGGGTESAGS